MRMLIAYHIPSSRRRGFAWTDGFAAGVGLLSSDWDVTWHNVGVDDEDDLLPLQEFDFVLVKSNWGWVVDRFVRERLTGSSTPRGLVISGSTHPPTLSRMKFYDVLFYQSEWYRPLVESHPLIFHTYGINTDIMKPSVQRLDKQYDWLTVGAFRRYKRQWLILSKSGSKAAVGDIDAGDPWVLEQLRRGGVTILDYMSQESLAELYGRVETVYIPAELHGGGERAIMEARACGTKVMIEPDNPKLAEFVESSTVLSHYYFRDQLARGIGAVLAAPQRTQIAVATDRVMRVIPDRRDAWRAVRGMSLRGKRRLRGTRDIG